MVLSHMPAGLSKRAFVKSAERLYRESCVSTQADGIFRRMLGLEDAQDVHAVDVMRAQRWKIVEPLTKSYFGNTIHLLGTAVAACVVDASASQMHWTALLSMHRAMPSPGAACNRIQPLRLPLWFINAR